MRDETVLLSEEFVDGETVVDGGAWGMLGVLPSRWKLIEVVRTRLSL